VEPARRGERRGGLGPGRAGHQEGRDGVHPRRHARRMDRRRHGHLARGRDRGADLPVEHARRVPVHPGELRRGRRLRRGPEAARQAERDARAAPQDPSRHPARGRRRRRLGALARAAEGARTRAEDEDARRDRSAHRRHPQGRALHHALHLGHDRRAQGRDDHARQHALRGGRGGRHAAALARRQPPLVPALRALVRADHQGGMAGQRADHDLRRVGRQAGRQRRRDRPHRALGGAARLREGLQLCARLGYGRSGPRWRALPHGDARVRALREGAAGGAQLQLARLRARQAPRLPQGQGQALEALRRPDPHLRLRRRSAGPEDRLLLRSARLQPLGRVRCWRATASPRPSR